MAPHLRDKGAYSICRGDSGTLPDGPERKDHATTKAYKTNAPTAMPGGEVAGPDALHMLTVKEYRRVSSNQETR